MLAACVRKNLGTILSSHAFFADVQMCMSQKLRCRTYQVGVVVHDPSGTTQSVGGTTCMWWMLGIIIYIYIYICRNRVGVNIIYHQPGTVGHRSSSRRMGGGRCRRWAMSTVGDVDDTIGRGSNGFDWRVRRLRKLTGDGYGTAAGPLGLRRERGESVSTASPRHRQQKSWYIL